MSEQFSNPQIRIARINIQQDWYSGKASFGLLSSYCGPPNSASILPCVGSTVLLDDPMDLIGGDNGAILQDDDTSDNYGEYYFPASDATDPTKQLYVTCWQPYDSPDGHWEFLKGPGSQPVPFVPEPVEFGNWTCGGNNTASASTIQLLSGDGLFTVTPTSVDGSPLSTPGIFVDLDGTPQDIGVAGDSLQINRRGVYQLNWDCTFNVGVSSGPCLVQNLPRAFLNGTQLGSTLEIDTFANSSGSMSVAATCTMTQQFAVTTADLPAIITFQVNVGPTVDSLLVAGEISLLRVGDVPPTFFGNLIPSAGSTTLTAGYFCTQGPFTIPNDGTLISLAVFCGSGSSGNVIMGLYTDNSGAPGGKLIARSGSVLIRASEWTYCNLKTQPGVTAGDVVWIGFLFDTGAPAIDIAPSGSSQLYYQGPGYTDLPKVAPTLPGNLANPFCVMACYNGGTL